MRILFRSITLILTSLFLLAGCNNEEKAAAPEPEKLKVVLAPVERIKVPVESTFNAVLAAKETVEVRSKISGYLMEKCFEEGSMVKAGDVIYRMDDRDLKAELATAHAQTVKAEASWKNADTTKKRYIPLAEKGAVSVQDRDNAVARADESFAFYTASKADEEKARVNLSYATIIAPITGFINRSSVDVGGYVEGGSVLLTTIYNMDPIRAEFSITDREYALFKNAMDEFGGDPEALSFTLYLGDDRIPYNHPGIIEMADPVMDKKTNTMGVRVEFPNPERTLRPGQYANVIGKITDMDALAVPEEAIRDVSGGKAVFIVDANNTLVSVPVEIGPRIDVKRVITKGLTEDQMVVEEGLVSAHPGMRVEVVQKSGKNTLEKDTAPTPQQDGAQGDAGQEKAPAAEEKQNTPAPQ